MGKRQSIHRKKDISLAAISHKVQNYIEYNNLDHSDRLFFEHCGLSRFVGIAGRILARRIGPVESHKIDRQYLSDNGLRILNGLVEELLQMIGRQSNRQRIGLMAVNQDQFFQKPGERDTFPAHLFQSRWLETKADLIRRDRNSAQKIEDNVDDIHGSLFSKKAFKDIPAAKKIKFGKSGLTETETRAVGVFYMINLVWKTMQEQQQILATDKATLDLATVLQSGFQLFSLLDESDQMIAHSEGGRAGEKKKDFREAAKIIKYIVESNPCKSTEILCRKAKIRIHDECVSPEIPSARWIADEVRRLKVLRRN